MKRESGAFCYKGNENGDVWGIVIHTDAHHKLIKFEMVLFYHDEDFLARGEKLNANRFFDPSPWRRHLEKVVNDVWQEQNLTASALFAMLDEAGFIKIDESSPLHIASTVPGGKSLMTYGQVVGKDNTYFAQDTLFFQFGSWMVVNNYGLYIIYDAETDEIISISNDANRPKSE